MLAAAWTTIVSARLVTIRNDEPRVDTNGHIVDAHDGMILAVGSPPTYYLYGERYGNTTGMYPWVAAPTVVVYTSPDLTTWMYRGPLLLNTTSPTQWIPNVMYDPRSARFILWYGVGDWGVAVSQNGINFTVVHEHESSRLGGQTDGTGIFIDDDGTGYVIFAALVDSPGESGHVVSIERLANDYLSSSLVNVSGFFPDGLVESPALFKRGSIYYATYGQCCCACRGGGGIVVFTASSVLGPWTRQQPHSDVNCVDAASPICRDTSRYVFNAQWWGVSLIPTSGGGTSYVFTGRRWLSGPGNPAGCADLCSNGGNPGACAAPSYFLSSDFDVWYPLEFNTTTGAVLPMRPLSSFTLDIP